MSRVHLSSWATLEALLRSDAVPAEVAGSPAHVGKDIDGVWIQAALDGPTEGRLRAGGARLSPDAGGGREVTCWAEAVPLRRGPPGESPRVLFELPADGLLALAGELVRLGCDRQSWARTGDVAWIEAVDPPWYSVLSALEGQGRAVYEPAGSDVWIPLGATHPFASGLRPSPGRTLLLGDVWRTVELPERVPLYERLELEVPGSSVLEGATDLPRLPVRLRLVDSGVSPAPTLWVLRQDGPSRVEQVLAHLPDDLVERLLFAVSGELVLLRARPSPAGPPTLEIDAETYTPLLELPNLFRPTDGTLEPPLRRDRIREVLSPEPWEIAWLARTPEGFRVERIAESAFRPLGEWVEYVVAKDARALEGWVAAAQFAFDSWVDVGVEWADRPTAPVEKHEARRRKAERPEAEEEDDDEPEEDEQPLWQAPQLRPARVEIAPDLKRTALAAELMELERSFKASEAGADAPERLDLWRRMATVHRRLGNGREAALCWVHAVWEAPDDAALARAWAEEELGAVGMDVDALREAVLREPLVDRLRAVGAALAAGALRGDAGLTPLFDRHSDQLDVRTAWLARTRIAGDDELAAARARDDALGRIRQGLSVEKDIPAFVRGLDADEATGVVDQLDAQLAHFRTTKRKRSVIEADPALTAAYVDLVFAWGYAAVGERERAEGLLAGARVLDRADPVHDALVSAYEARIQQALQGVPRDTPLPPEASAKLAGLPSFQRYQVDRLRNASGILETHERLDPFRAFERQFDDSRGPEFAALRGETDTAVLRPALAGLVDVAREHDEKERLIDGVFDFLPLLSAVDALPLFDALVVLVDGLEPAARVRLLTDGLVVAGLLGRTERARDLSRRIVDAIRELPIADLGAITEGLSGSLRGLRRVGLEDEARSLLEAVQSALAVDPDAAVVVLRDDAASRLTRAGVVGGLLALRAPGALDQLDVLLGTLDENLPPLKRLPITRALGMALASAPRAEAFARLPKLSEHLPSITDSFNTNSHFCLSVVSYAESVVLGYADTELGSRARAWMDASEFRVRRRIHS